MIKQYPLIGILTLILNYHAVAQHAEIAEAIVSYKFSHLMDTADRNSVYQEDMKLYIGKNSSMYISGEKLIYDSLRTEQNKSRNNVGAINVKGMGSNTSFFYFVSENQWQQTEKLFINNYLFPIDKPQMNWVLSSDTLTISGLKCQKATGHWKGRDYVAWFCPSLPFSFGPWKFNGLPGLILTVRDTKDQVKFEFEDFKVNNDESKVIRYPKDRLTNVTQKEFNGLKLLFETNPRAYLQSIVGTANMNSIVIAPSFSAIPPPKNPIEISGK